MNWFDTARPTWLHRANPTLKLIVFLVIFLYILLIHNVNVMVNVTAVTLILYAAFTGHSWRVLLLLLVPFVLLFLSSGTSMVFFGKGETTWVRWGPVHITAESFLRGLHIGFKSISFALVGLVLALTTRPVQLFYSLMQQARLPAKFAYSFMAAIRLLPMMAEELRTLRMALKVRGADQAGGLRGMAVLMRRLTVPLLAQSIRRAQRMAVAMEAKRFSKSSKRTYYYKVGFSAADLVLVLYFLIALTAAHMAGLFFPYIDSLDVRL
ncbi:energy-coupling factor transporter transmembrane component T family protein [Paenibacillus sp. y28]|uniref:energy-coupling factor transporter transmembrane component T family protein n=1 Tax=Paenibacillus sp. y28 TaxID=3129110 RepID=UPI00301B3206